MGWATHADKGDVVAAKRDLFFRDRSMHDELAWRGFDGLFHHHAVDVDHTACMVYRRSRLAQAVTRLFV